MSFQGFVDTGPRSACDTSDPSNSRRSTRRSADDTTSSRPSGKKSMHIGNEATSASTVGEPSAATEMTRPAPQSENHSRSSRQRGDSPNTMPSISTSMGEETLLDARTHRRDRTSYSRDHRRNRLPPGPSAETTSCPAAAHLVDRCEAALKPLPSGTQVEPPDADPLHPNEPFGLLEAAVKALGPVPERLGVPSVDVETLRRALVEQGFTEAAAMVEADVERQAEEEAEGGEVIDMTALLGPASQGQDLDHGLRRGGVSASDHALPDLSAGTLRTSWSRGVGRELGVFRLV